MKHVCLRLSETNTQSDYSGEAMTAKAV